MAWSPPAKIPPLIAPAITPTACSEVDDFDSSPCPFGAALVLLIVGVNNGDFIEFDRDETEEKASPELMARRKSTAANL
jgi:hypothetical protein